MDIQIKDKVIMAIIPLVCIAQVTLQYSYITHIIIGILFSLIIIQCGKVFFTELLSVWSLSCVGATIGYIYGDRVGLTQHSMFTDVVTYGFIALAPIILLIVITYSYLHRVHKSKEQMFIKSLQLSYERIIVAIQLNTIAFHACFILVYLYRKGTRVISISLLVELICFMLVVAYVKYLIYIETFKYLETLEQEEEEKWNSKYEL